jgi:outer membrane protein assembly factor BamB
VVRRPVIAVFGLVLIASCATVSGQQPKGRPEPYVAPLLPGEQAWLVALPALPSAGGAMDDDRVYVPLQDVVTLVDGERIVKPGSASVVALTRQTGVERWSAPIATAVAPVVDRGRVLVAASDGIRALDAETGATVWTAPLGGAVRSAMLVRGDLLLAFTEPDSVTALRLDTREIAWTASVGAGPVLMDADLRAVYLTAPGSRVLCLRLADGTRVWERTLAGDLSAPAIGRDRVLVGSTVDSLWALDPESGDDEWVWPRRVFGGDVIGAVLDDDLAYVVSLDNIVRAVNRGNGNQRWKTELVTRPIQPPRVFFGTVVVTGLTPAISTFAARDGTAVATWAPPPPADAELQGPPLIDEYLDPFGVAMVVILRDGRVFGVRPVAMTFPEPASAPLRFVPGRALPAERLPGEAEPVTPGGMSR